MLCSCLLKIKRHGGLYKIISLNLVSGSGGDGYDGGLLNIISVRMIRELCKGRLTEREVYKIMKHNDWDLDKTTNAILNSNELQAFLKDDVIRDLLKKQSISSEIRQFACAPCDHVWWRNVPARKTVSRCRRCRIKYDAIPQDQQWGWAIFRCHCGKVFSGFGQMNVTESKCYQQRGGCGQLALPCKIRPPERRDRTQKSRSRHSCNAPDCPSNLESVIDRKDAYGRRALIRVLQPNRNLIYLRGHRDDETTKRKPCQRSPENQPGRSGLAPTCVHPISRTNKPRVIVPSVPHISTGSTVDTFLNQRCVSSVSSFQPSELDIPEEIGAAVD
ncbi:hypothetical protein ACJMK2_014854 [Sinanodonta woodiana]|uniref:Uncharacterized protein n=1 Tax=Sinanodonta woodiana TaxID=1069815 RepID=A0ABD3V1V2_SINWO